MNEYYIALNPEKKLTDLINEQKSMVRTMIGEQTYLSHPPHFTLFHFTLRDPEKFYPGLEKIARNTNSFPINLRNFYIFHNYSFTNGNIITYSVLNKDLNSLRKIQQMVINEVNPFNMRGIYLKENESYRKMSKAEKNNINDYGFPFVGDSWIPHITIALINSDKFSEVFEKIKEKPVFGKFLIDSINLYKVGEKTSELIKKFELK
jgi:2'-5' RNA ligase